MICIGTPARPSPLEASSRRIWIAPICLMPGISPAGEDREVHADRERRAIVEILLDVEAHAKFSSGMSTSAWTAVPSGRPAPVGTLSSRHTTEPM